MTPRDWNEMKKLLADVAKGNDVQEVLAKLGNGVAGVTAQTKKFSNTINVSVKASDGSYSVTGSGRVVVLGGISNNTAKLTVTADGKAITIGCSSDYRNIEIYFETSLTISNDKDYNGWCIIQF